MVRIEELEVKATLPKGRNPLPLFCEKEHEAVVELYPEVPAEYRTNLRFGCGRKILPYLLQDRYDRNRVWTPLKTIVLENNHLRATFLPSLGGRLISLYDKNGKRELLYDNRNIQIADPANRNAWFVGGIEWNVGRYGHFFSTCSDVYFAKVSGDHIRMYDYERGEGVWWRIDFFLSEGDRMLSAVVTIDNKKKTRQSLYYWTNIAVEQTEKTRVFASSTHALYLDAKAHGKQAFGYMNGPDSPLLPGIDVSYPANWPFSEQYFFTCNHDPMPWEVVVQDDGCGLMEASSPFLGYRKMFCWGTGKSGRNWQRFLAPERDGSYVEIQAGLAPTQFHDKFIEAESSVRWLQMFGPVAIGRRMANYTEERNDVTQAVETLLDAKRIVREEKRRSKELDEPETQMLHYGNGWAYLEKTVCKEEPDVVYRVRREDVPSSLSPWLRLAEEGKAPAYDPLRLPPVIGQPWMELLKRSEGEPMSLSYWGGIMLAETGKDAEALELFQLVHKHMHDAYSARNIARILLREGKKVEALLWYQAATYSNGYGDDPAITEEYVALLLETKEWTTAHAILSVLPAKLATNRIRMQKAVLASHERNSSLLVRLIAEGFPNIREGENLYKELWISLLYMRVAPHERRTTERTRQLLAEHPLPDSLSFSTADDRVAQG
ncbi:MAG: DUF5107 domain-containing protein [Sphaerochaetaceae bacterium]|jgi:hypothetical protein